MSTPVPPVVPSTLQPSPEPAPFKDPGSALKVLRSFKPPISDQQRDGFLARVASSATSRYIAFMLLAEGWNAKPPAVLPLLRPGLKDIVSAGHPYPSSETLAKLPLRRLWVQDEFGISGRKGDSALFNESHGYLWPLYVILSAPDNETWLAAALDHFVVLLEASLDVGQGKAGAPKSKTNSGLSVGKTLALEIASLTSSNPLGVKPLKTHLRILGLGVGLVRVNQSETELRTNQTRVLEELRDTHQTKIQTLTDDLESMKATAKTHEETIEALRAQIAQTEQQRLVMEGRSESRLKEELLKQRSQLRFLMSEGLTNIKLYADRSEPAKARILELSDELLAALDGK